MDEAIEYDEYHIDVVVKAPVDRELTVSEVVDAIESEPWFHVEDTDAINSLVGDFCDGHNLELGEQVHKLSEESGEVSGAFLSLEGKQRFKETIGKEHFAKELAQVVYTAETIAYLASIDLRSQTYDVALENSTRESVDD